MTKKEKKWLHMLKLWEDIQSAPEHRDLSLWDRVEVLASEVGMTPHGVRKFLIRNNQYDLIVTI